MTDRVLRLGIFALLVVCFLPYLSPSVLPVHDSGLKHASFYHFYSTLVTAHELARWVPHAGYGIDAAYFQWHGMTAVDYVIGVAGWLVGATDTLLLWKLGILLQLAVFIGGVVGLAERLFERRATRVFVAGGAVLSLAWLVQPYFNLTLFYAIPLVLRLLLDFVDREDAAAFWTAVLAIAVAQLGNVVYGVFLQVMVFTLFVAVTGWGRHRRLAQALLAAGWRPPPFILCVLVGGIFVAFFIEMLHGTVTLSTGRETKTFVVPLDVFLSYARVSLATTVYGTLTGGIVLSDNTYYVGLLPLALFVYALVYVTNRVFLALAAIVVALWWLSVGGWFATLVYFFPGMALFRHVSLVFGVANGLLLIASTFGLEELLRRVGGEERPPAARGRWLTLGVIAVAVAADVAHTWHDELVVALLDVNRRMIGLVVRVALYAGAGLVAAFAFRASRATEHRTRAGWAAAILVGVHLADVGSFQAHVLSAVPRARLDVATQAIYRVERAVYRPARVDMPSDDRARAALTVFARPTAFDEAVIDGQHVGGNVTYDIAYSVAGFDPCLRRYRTLVLSAAVFEMLQAHAGRLVQFPEPDFRGPRDGFWRSLGCAHPKIWMAKPDTQAGATALGPDAFRRIEDPRRRVMLEDSSGGTDLIAAGVELDRVSVTRFSANAIDIEARIDADAPAYLVYADSYDPGWEAFVDGVARPVLRANVGFKAVKVDPGIHTVSFRYKRGLAALAPLALAAIGFAGGLWFLYAKVAGLMLGSGRGRH